MRAWQFTSGCWSRAWHRSRAPTTERRRGGPADDSARYAPLRTLLATPVRSGTNLVIVSHGNPFRAVAGPPYLAEGEAAVIQPLGDERFRIVARIRPDAWDALRQER